MDGSDSDESDNKVDLEDITNDEIVKLLSHAEQELKLPTNNIKEDNNNPPEFDLEIEDEEV